ncbi:MAG: CoA transferase [Chloroflexi bacterium]|nr:CoA transferase [Chloroflexota bacterium]MYF81247.1 CoA transferase [Chloroflexota bacterium]MYI04692.1 CoA transferase [Chloroflexota bacterium]
MNPGPLDGVTVLDLTEHIAGPYCTKLFADFGADVIKVERPDGDPSRSVGPWHQGIQGPERSGTFFYFNTNKRSLVLDIERPEAVTVIERLLARADIVVESQPAGRLDSLGLGWERVSSLRDDLPMVSITPFGQDSPYRDFKISDLVLYGFAGEMYSIGVQDREPVKMYGTASLVECGAAAATGAMAALTAAELQGVGQHVDFSMADAQFNGVDRRHAATIGFEFAGRRSLRAPGPAAGMLAGVYPCADGYIEFSGAAIRIPRLNEMLGRPDWLQDEKWWQPGVGLIADLVDEFNGLFLPWALERTKREIWEAAREAKVLCGPLFSVDELFEDTHFSDRGFWSTAEHDELGEVKLLGRPLTMPASPWSIRRPPPRLGEHTDEVLSELGFEDSEIAELRASGATS